jgi:hypothetical protein
MSVIDAPDSSVTDRANSSLLIPRPGTEWKVMISAPGESVLAQNGTVDV